MVGWTGLVNPTPVTAGARWEVVPPRVLARARWCNLQSMSMGGGSAPPSCCLGPPRRAYVPSRHGRGRPASSTTAGWGTSAPRSCTTSTASRTEHLADLMDAAAAYLCFGPDTLVEARNRGYHPCTGRCPAPTTAPSPERARRHPPQRSGVLRLVRLPIRPTSPGPPPGSQRGARRWSCATASRPVIARRRGRRASFPQLADRIATDMGWMVLTFNFRGRASPRATSRWPGGWTTCTPPSTTCRRWSGCGRCGWPASAPAAPCASGRAPTRGSRLEGVAALGVPADFDDWAEPPPPPPRARARSA